MNEIALVFIPNLKFNITPNIKYTIEIRTSRIMPLYTILLLTASPTFLIFVFFDSSVSYVIPTKTAITNHAVRQCPVMSRKLGLLYFYVVNMSGIVDESYSLAMYEYMLGI